MTTAQEEQIRILRELEGDKCCCGAKKRRMGSFCQAHYFSLPGHMRSMLYQRIGHGYEEAYAEARKYIEQEKEAKV